MEKDFKKTYLLLLFAAILWGGQPAVIKGLVKELSPVLITFYRYLGISAILLLILFISNGRITIPRGRHILILGAMGLSGVTLNNIFQFSGLQYSTAINCSLVSSTTPVITAVLAAVFLREKLTVIQWLGITISFLGIFFLVTHGSLETIMTLSFNYGDILFFASQLCWAIYTILGRKIMVELSPLATTAWAGLAATVMTGLYAVWSGIDMTPVISSSGIAGLAYMTIGGGVLAMTWWNQGVKVVGPSTASIFFNVVPIVGMIIGVTFLSEPLGWNEIVAGLGIIFGVYLSTHGYKRFEEKQRFEEIETVVVTPGKSR